MALVPICYRIPYKGHIQPIRNVIGGPSSSKGLESRLRCSLAHNSQEHNRGMVPYASDARTNEKQLSSLDSYFEKLQNSTTLPSENSSKTTEPLGRKNGHLGLEEELEYLDAYLEKLNKDANQIEKPVDLATGDNIVPKSSSIIQKSKKGAERKLVKSFTNTTDDNGQDSEISDLYLVSILGSINIAVFLFEIASPVRNSDLELFSLPLLYGAKMNDLILVGEWWRLVTPMFLHAGLIHIAIGSWGLVTFGPKVCRGYGSFTFFLIYILGGISGNLISFLHTPEPTVGGTGPIFAMIGAWLIYETQNKDITAKEVSETMFQKAIITTALTFTVSSFGPIDDWTHFGAALTGIAYGFLTCPSLQLDEASSSSTSGQEEGITLVRRYADPCKSLFLFTVFVLVLSSLLLFFEPPLNALASDSSV
ncbi:RHOMBOID-like protein 9, chloroplastic isoform X1 [Rosa rugosa]|uniref:RHOMBOID-like protein 9, chloroplastic isoform X1 n=1 Tax=Rosa rugosa TaxID=74645 RepID=UPI002B401A34|nr:RHOMBOID-like protein 9, chloroplastic isoform X1 [Rosa rugosa]XP_062009655.1 RHOMBOID-like protein 9, chloroplastic isoform X1 [Rosa rugosa]XP_062009656.1 RHOMBOID-like protein 9, chloroplastic isoform X1 [Rosa rugosa]